MATVKEVVRFGPGEGANITLNLTEQEHAYLLEFAVNELVARGLMVLGDTQEKGVLLGTDEAIKRVKDAN